MTAVALDQLPYVKEFFFQDPADPSIGYRWAAPSTREELFIWFRDYFGLTLAPTAVCPGHTSPLDAVWEAYTGIESITVWKASRGLGGKSTMLAGLSVLELLDGHYVTVLGGSSQQSQRVHEEEQLIWDRTAVLRDRNGIPYARVRRPFGTFLAAEPTMYFTRLKEGNWLRALTASTRSARGPHPTRLRLDEADEMDLRVFDAAMGQTMIQNGLVPQTVISSTHHYPDGTFTEILKRAAERGWPVREWCWRETHVDNGGWLVQSEVDRKQNEVTKQMWITEYDLQEPSSEGRAIDTDLVKLMFSSKYGVYDDAVGKYLEFEAPVQGAKYATGADWARTQDYTVIITMRYDVTPVRVVAFERIRRRPWPLMIARMNERLERYPGRAAHDATGVGDVVDSYIEEHTNPMKMVGNARSSLFTDYIKGIESRQVICPQIRSMYNEHLYVTVDDLATGGGHPPDTFVAGSMAWMAAEGKTYGPKKRRPGRLAVVTRF